MEQDRASPVQHKDKEKEGQVLELQRERKMDVAEGELQPGYF